MTTLVVVRIQLLLFHQTYNSEWHIKNEIIDNPVSRGMPYAYDSPIIYSFSHIQYIIR